MRALRRADAREDGRSGWFGFVDLSRQPPWVSLRTLKLAGVVLPIAFVLLLEVLRFTLVEWDLESEESGEVAGHIALAGATVVCVVAFGSVMFFFINRAQEQVLRQNRQLVAVNAVSTAVRDGLEVEQIVERALDSVLMACGARAASLTVNGGDRVHRTQAGGSEPGGSGSGGSESGADGTVLDLALTAGATSVGSLRLHLPGRGSPDGPTADALQTIGQQVAYAIQRAQLLADLTRGRDEGHAFYEILLQISNQRPTSDTLRAVARYARDGLDADRAMLCLNDSGSRIVVLDGMRSGPPQPGGQSPVPDPHGAGDVVVGGPPAAHAGPRIAVPLGTPGASYGDLWVARGEDRPFTERDRRFLQTLAELTAIALSGARMRENEHQGAIVAERERIARELHDSLAQVLGVTHLRLHALRGRADVRAADGLDTELEDLAGICHAAYQDVREAILGLGESARADRDLLDALRAYLGTYSRQAAVQARLDAPDGQHPILLPRCEVQVIRIIQEALTNVRKHACAGTVVVRVRRIATGLRVEVEDDGDGFDSDALDGDTGHAGRDGFRFGLHSMSERARLVGGELRVDSTPGRGTRVRVDVPAAMVQWRVHDPGTVRRPATGSRGAR